MTFLDLSKDQVATSDRRGGQICKMFCKRSSMQCTLYFRCYGWRQVATSDKSTRCSCQIFSGFKIPKIIKIVSFKQSYSKIKNVDVLGDSVDTATLLLYPDSGLVKQNSDVQKERNRPLNQPVTHRIQWKVCRRTSTTYCFENICNKKQRGGLWVTAEIRPASMLFASNFLCVFVAWCLVRSGSFKLFTGAI